MAWDGWGSLLCRAALFHGADSLCALPAAGSAVSCVFRLFLPGSVSHMPLLVCLICGPAVPVKVGSESRRQACKPVWDGEGSLGKGCRESSAFHVICIPAVSLVPSYCWLSRCLRMSAVNLLSDSGCPMWSLAEWHPRRWSAVTNISCVQTVIYPGQA